MVQAVITYTKKFEFGCLCFSYIISYSMHLCSC